MFADVLREVAAWRKDQRKWEAAVADAKKALEATGEWKTLEAAKANMKISDTQLSIAERAAREVIASNWDGQTKHSDGWGIRMMPHIEYNLDIATEWARQNLPTALILDRKVWEKVAPSLPNAPVKVFDVPTAILATDLTRFEEE